MNPFIYNTRDLDTIKSHLQKMRMEELADYLGIRPKFKFSREWFYKFNHMPPPAVPTEFELWALRFMTLEEKTASWYVLAGKYDYPVYPEDI